MPQESAAPKKRNRFVRFVRSGWGITIIALVVIFALYKLFHHAKSPYQLIPVKTGTINETVSVTGNTTPIQSVSLGFQNSGTIAAVYHDIGENVAAGTVIAALNTSDLAAQVEQAQANVDSEKAKLAGLEAGAQPQDIAVSQATLSKAQQDLANMYASIDDASTTAFASANDAVRTQLSTFFSNAETTSVQLTFQTSDSSASNQAQLLRVTATTTLNAWQAEIAALSSSSSTTTLLQAATDGVTALGKIQSLLTAVSTALNGAVNLSAAQLAADKASVTVATNEVNGAVSNLNTITQNIASQNLLVAQLQAQLALKQAGSTSTDIAAQEAQVEEAQAAVASAQAKLDSSEIVAPLSGVITQQDAKIGQIASPGTPLVSIMSNGNFEVDAQVPETDVGKLAVGNAVSMTFDAFPGETFTGKVFYIDPAETIDQGVVDYKIKVSFDAPDARMKSGLTANLDIQTKSHANALILPQYAILVNDSGSFVETLSAKNAVVTTPVTLGIQDENGNVEVLSGVTAGEEVLNIGLKVTS